MALNCLSCPLQQVYTAEILCGCSFSIAVLSYFVFVVLKSLLSVGGTFKVTAKIKSQWPFGGSKSIKQLAEGEVTVFFVCKYSSLTEKNVFCYFSFSQL